MSSFYLENKNVGNKAESEDWRSMRTLGNSYKRIGH
jgi:hypothetical protein